MASFNKSEQDKVNNKHCAIQSIDSWSVNVYFELKLCYHLLQ